jgi:hypothetical protein
MRFPIDPLPPVGVTDDPFEIQEKAAINALRPVGPRTPPRLITPQRRPAPAPDRPPQQQASEAERRAHEDRRTTDRRTQNQPVTVDTRSGADRRKGKRREDDPTTRIDLKA